MNSKDTLENNCNSVDNIRAYLRRKGQNHNYYKCYASLERIKGIRDEKCLYLGNGGNWNDIPDRENFNSDKNDYINFGRCFSFSQDENVAMWMLYGGINKRGGMIDFTKKGIQSILDVSDITIGYFDNDIFKSVQNLTRKDFEIYITDVIYYQKRGSVYYINRSDEAYRKLSEEIFKELNACKKSYPWKYENECRLIVSVRKNLLKSNCNVIRINLEDMDLGKSYERIYRAPNYPLAETYGTLPSRLDKTIDWSLCDRKTCGM